MSYLSKAKLNFLTMTLASVQLPLRRGMTLCNGDLVLHGEVGHMPRQDGDQVTLCGNSGSMVRRLSWNGEEWIDQEDEAVSEMVPDVSHAETMALVYAAFRERCTGESVADSQSGEYLDDFLLAMAPIAIAHCDLSPDERARMWEESGREILRGMVGGTANDMAGKLKESVMQALKEGGHDEAEAEAADDDCDCSLCVLRRSVMGREEVEVVVPDPDGPDVQALGVTPDGDPVMALRKGGVEAESLLSMLMGSMAKFQRVDPHNLRYSGSDDDESN